jgi:uncharacterized protein YerC
MKYITEQKLSELMEYSSLHSLKNSKTNYKLLKGLIEYIEIESLKDYDKKLSLLKKQFKDDITLLSDKYIK